jgi:hypothetical protein
MGRRVGILPLKEEQHAHVGLRVQVFGLELDQGLKFGDGQLRPPLSEILLCQTRVGCCLVLKRKLGQKRKRDQDG